MYYWRDIDTIAPRQSVRARQNNKMIQPERQEQSPAKDEVISTHQSDWREMAQRLQAEMDNFRKRQERRADEAISREREQLLSLFLPAVDNLTRALAYRDDQTEEGVRQGIELTHRELVRALEAEGVTPLEAIGQAFDPAWHEAVATIPAEVESGIVVEQVEVGYKLGDKLLRPAKVVVAV
jgi:molecular chaperone GrpE